MKYSNIFNYFLAEGEREIWFNITTRNMYFYNLSVKLLKIILFLLIPQLCFTIKECKKNNLTMSDSICLVSMLARDLSMRIAVSIFQL